MNDEPVERMRFGPNELTFKDATGKVTLAIDGSAPVKHTYEGTPEYRIRNMDFPKSTVVTSCTGIEWARIDKDMNVTFLDMDKCAEGPANHYTALALAAWNAAIEESAKFLEEHEWASADNVRGLKK